MPAATAKTLKLELYLKLCVMQYTIRPISSSPTAMSDQPTLLSVSAAMLRANIKYTDRVRLHPNLARLPPMPYRHRDSMSRKLRAMRDARERRRLEGVEPRYPRDLPALRRTLIIIDYDFGKVEHRIDLYRTPRIDCYRAVADGMEWKRRVGWSKVLAGLRVKFPRVRAP